MTDTIPQTKIASTFKSDETEQEKLLDAISRLEDSVSTLEEISSIDVIDTSPSEVEYQLQDMSSYLTNIRMVIDTLGDLQCNIFMTEDQFLKNNKEVEDEILKSVLDFINGELK